MNFTKEEISLCKKIAEKHRKEITFGDYMIIDNDPHEVPTIFIGQDFSATKRSMIPLWQISDCLEFMRKKGYRTFGLEGLIAHDIYSLKIEEGERSHVETIGNTYLEAFLKAVLAIAGESS